ncbi:MAG: ATP-dependent Clp protease ATP-binding subunit, partial [Firmicutes bacterium]|nr:ATP-dependent Clp protease ATP-binding subunit [Bacillota bacterium]
MNQFTQRSQKVMNVALQVARKLNSSVVGTEHLLAGLILEEQGVAARVLRALNFPANAFLRELEGTAAGGHLVLGQNVDYSPRSKHALALAKEVSAELGVDYIATEHLLLGILRENEGFGATALKESGITEEAILALLNGEQPAAPANTPKGAPAKGKSNTPELDKCGRDLTEMAKNGDLDPVIGREKEIERVVQILSRRTKNNPVLIGEPGV